MILIPVIYRQEPFLHLKFIVHFRLHNNLLAVNSWFPFCEFHVIFMVSLGILISTWPSFITGRLWIEQVINAIKLTRAESWLFEPVTLYPALPFSCLKLELCGYLIAAISTWKCNANISRNKNRLLKPYFGITKLKLDPTSNRLL